MKVFKPFPLSLVTRCFEFRGRTSLGVSALVMVGLGQGPRRLWQEKDLWTFWATRAEAQWPLEEGVPRVRSEYLVSGSAYNPDPARASCNVGVRIGALQKRLQVHGERYWDGDDIVVPAQNFETLALGWQHAWGGPAFAANPLGMGIAPHEVDGHALRLLPRIEHPQHALHSPRAEGVPAGFGPIDGMWPQRASKRGTYDQRWFTEEFPAIASDADWTTFNAASDDQQQPEPFRGDEPYAFHGLHPTAAVLEGQLPGLRARAFVTHRAGGEDKFKELRMRLNTLWCFPGEERAILIFQGMHEIAEDDGADIVHLLAGLEDLDTPRPAAHYLAVRDKRLDKQNGALEALREGDLMPTDLVVPLFDFAPMENRGLERGQRRAEAERQAARDFVVSCGMDPDAGHAPVVKAPPQPEVRTLDDLIALRATMDAQTATLRAESEQGKAAMLAEMKQLFAQEKKDFGLIEREMAGLATRGPPKPYATALVQSFEGFIADGQPTNPAGVQELVEMLADDKLVASWHEGDRKQLQSYRTMAHYQVPVDRLAGEASAALRARVMAHHGQDGSFAGWDLTGADLSGLDLHGANFKGALLEGANLTGTVLSGADLQDAVLAHATLRSTRCDGARLDRANLGAAHIEKSDFAQASLVDLVLQKARVVETSLSGCRIDGIRLDEAVLVEVDFSRSTADAMLVFYQRDLRGCSFAGARYAQSTFVECQLGGADFSDAVLTKCAFVTVQAAQANFSGLQIVSGCFAQGCVLTASNFARAALPNISFRGAQLAGASFRGARLQGADFSDCALADSDFGETDLREARFVRADLRAARFGAANMIAAVFQHATLDNTDYRNANLFRSDFARVRVGAAVQFEGALTARMRTRPRHRPASID